MKCAFAWMIVAVCAMPAMAFDAAGWARRCEVETGDAVWNDASGSAQFARLPLTPEVLDLSLPDGRDLRLVDNDGALVPYVVHRERAVAETRVVWRPVALINRTYVPGEYVRVVLDFGTFVEKNRVRVRLSGPPSCRRAVLEGGATVEAWEHVLDDAWLVRLPSSGQGAGQDTLTFPANTFRYLRLTVFLTPGDPAKIDLQDVEGAFVETALAKDLIPIPVSVTKIDLDDKLRQSKLDFDLGHRNLSPVRLDVAFQEPYYYRAYQLFGRDTLVAPVNRFTDSALTEEQRETPWQFVDAGVLYRVPSRGGVSETAPITLGGCTYRYLQLRIDNRDDAPLVLAPPVTAYRRGANLVFEYDPAHTYALYFANPKARSVEFDLARSMPDVTDRPLPELRLGVAEALAPIEPKAPWSERHAILLWSALLVAIAALVGLIAVNLRRMNVTKES